MRVIGKSLTIKEYAAIVMILLASGTAYFYMFHAGITLILLLFMAVVVAVYDRTRLCINSFGLVYGILILVNAVLYGFSRSLLGDLLLFVSTGLITSSFSYDAFRRGFLNVVVTLSIISIIIYVLFLLEMVNPVLQGIGKNGLEGYYIYAFHVFGGGHYIGLHNKLCGMFWEPGVYQMVLNTCIIMNIDLLDNKTQIRKKNIKLSILILTVILIQSTTGYLTLGLILVGYYLKKSKNSITFKVVTIFVSVLFAIVIVVSPVITDKFSLENHSFLVRANDFIGLSYSIFEKPLFGLGVGSTTFEQISNKYGMTSALSAGILLMTAQFGLLWIMAFYSSLIKEYKKRGIQLPKFVYMLAITFLGIGEPLAFSPLFLINVLPFKKYDHK